LVVLTAREWRRLGDQAGRLQYFIAEIREARPARLREAEEAYRLWLEGRASYRETERRLKKLLDCGQEPC